MVPFIHMTIINDHLVCEAWAKWMINKCESPISAY